MHFLILETMLFVLWRGERVAAGGWCGEQHPSTGARDGQSGCASFCGAPYLMWRCVFSCRAATAGPGKGTRAIAHESPLCEVAQGRPRPEARSQSVENEAPVLDTKCVGMCSHRW